MHQLIKEHDTRGAYQLGLQIKSEADKLHVQPALGFNDSPFPRLEQKSAFLEACEPQKEQSMVQLTLLYALNSSLV